jgi:hypothetical protein
VVQAPTTVVVNFTGRAGFFNYADMQVIASQRQ